MSQASQTSSVGTVVEADKTADTAGGIERQSVAQWRAAIMGDDTEPSMPQLRHELDHVPGHFAFGVVLVVGIGRGSATCAIPTQIRYHERKLLCEQWGQEKPMHMGLRKAMQQQERRTLTANAAMDRGVLAADSMCCKSLKHPHRSQ